MTLYTDKNKSTSTCLKNMRIHVIQQNTYVTCDNKKKIML